MSDLEEAKSARDQLTKQLGDVVRQFSLGGLAIIWILKSEPVKSGIAVANAGLPAPLVFFLLSLFLRFASIFLVGGCLGHDRYDLVSSEESKESRRPHAEVV
jgi:hypothetical protein